MNYPEYRNATIVDLDYITSERRSGHWAHLDHLTPVKLIIPQKRSSSIFP